RPGPGGRGRAGGRAREVLPRAAVAGRGPPAPRGARLSRRIRRGASTAAARPARPPGPTSLRPARDRPAGPGSAGVEVLLQRLHGGVVGAEVPHAVVAVTDRGAQRSEERRVGKEGESGKTAERL